MFVSSQRTSGNPPTVAVVIPTLNRDDLLERCLEYLSSQTFQDFCTIVVDNSDREVAPAFLIKQTKSVWLPLLKNCGTATAFNRGISAAVGSKYVFMLNNDTEVENSCLEQLVCCLESEKDFSIAVPKLLMWSDPRYLDGVGDEILKGGGAYRVGRGELDAGQYDRPQPVFSACAAAALYRMSVFDDVGLFDEDFVAYREDVDFGLRAQLRKHQCIYVPSARVRHHGSATMGEPAHPWIVRLSTRNQIVAILKNYPRAALLRFLPELLVFQLLWFGFAIRRHSFLAACLGLLDIIPLLPNTLAKRKRIQSAALISSKCFLMLIEQSELRIRKYFDSVHAPQPSPLLMLYFRLC